MLENGVPDSYLLSIISQNTALSIHRHFDEEH